jgi:hypothetical protein
MSEDYLPDATIADALGAQREAIAALRSKVSKEPGNVSACKELSMASKRLAEMVKMYELERRITELEGNDA